MQVTGKQRTRRQSAVKAVFVMLAAKHLGTKMQVVSKESIGIEFIIQLGAKLTESKREGSRRPNSRSHALHAFHQLSKHRRQKLAQELFLA